MTKDNWFESWSEVISNLKLKRKKKINKESKKYDGIVCPRCNSQMEYNGQEQPTCYNCHYSSS